MSIGKGASVRIALRAHARRRREVARLPVNRQVGCAVDEPPQAAAWERSAARGDRRVTVIACWLAAGGNVQVELQRVIFPLLVRAFGVRERWGLRATDSHGVCQSPYAVQVVPVFSEVCA